MTALAELRTIAAGLAGIDRDCYLRHGRDPHEPVIGLGASAARWCFFGRDPGEQEVRLQQPFVGPAGGRIRALLAELGIPASAVFWMNTVPFKPVGNKPWPLAVQRQCRPALAQLLAGWQGRQVIAFGEAAMRWFGLDDAAARQEIDRFWRRPDKYEAQLTVDVALAGARRSFDLCPVPHPSGANARWAGAFAGLLRARLAGGAA